MGTEQSSAEETEIGAEGGEVFFPTAFVQEHEKPNNGTICNQGFGGWSTAGTRPCRNEIDGVVGGPSNNLIS